MTNFKVRYFDPITSGTSYQKWPVKIPSRSRSRCLIAERARNYRIGKVAKKKDLQSIKLARLLPVGTCRLAKESRQPLWAKYLEARSNTKLQSAFAELLGIGVNNSSRAI
jgi:hypothetical protein